MVDQFGLPNNGQRFFRERSAAFIPVAPSILRAEITLKSMILGCRQQHAPANLRMEETEMRKQKFPPGWDEERVQELIAHYESQTED